MCRSRILRDGGGVFWRGDAEIWRIAEFEFRAWRRVRRCCGGAATRRVWPREGFAGMGIWTCLLAVRKFLSLLIYYLRCTIFLPAFGDGMRYLGRSWRHPGEPLA